jgi:hypothetical protein
LKLKGNGDLHECKKKSDVNQETKKEKKNENNRPYEYYGSLFIHDDLFWPENAQPG